MSNIIQTGSVSFGGDELPIIAGPCVIESRDHSLAMAEALANVCSKTGVPLVFKSSFDKANRTTGDSFRGPGMEEGLQILSDVKETVGVPVLTDIHHPEQASIVAEVADILQIPAFLCRQTEKIEGAGGNQILLTDRGTTFGYESLVSDMRSIPVMKETGYPVIFDATHSAQMPGTGGGKTGGTREFIPTLAKAAVAAGADSIFMEVHDNVDSAKSDAATQWPLDQLADLLAILKDIRNAVNGMDRFIRVPMVKN